MIQQWMISVTTQQLNQFLPTITVTEAEMTTYLVLKKEGKKPEEAAKPSPMDTTSPGASQPEEGDTRVCLRETERFVYGGGVPVGIRVKVAVRNDQITTRLQSLQSLGHHVTPSI